VSLLDIHVLGSPILRQETKPVAEITPELQQLIDDMFETMHAAEGIGLAAPQVGRSERVTVIEIDGERLVLINPEIVHADGKARGEEGCLSIPEVYADVDRSARVVVEALDRDGQPITVEATDLLARCLQHEIDHLHGKLFIDHLGAFRRRSAMQKWESVKEDYPGMIRTLSAEEVAKHHHNGDTEL
jgi:peptide deformylase